MPGSFRGRAGKQRLLCCVLWALTGTLVHGQKEVKLDDHFHQHIFSYGEIESFEDPQGVYSIRDVSKADFGKFRPGNIFIPKNYHYQSTYWYRIKIRNDQSRQKDWVLEFYDQTIDQIDFYVPEAAGGGSGNKGENAAEGEGISKRQGGVTGPENAAAVNGSIAKEAGATAFKEFRYGAGKPFAERLFFHKNVTVSLDGSLRGERVYYFSVRSQQPSNIMVVLKPLSWFIQYGLKEYLLSGIFYGMILVFCLYNLVMFFAFRQKQYLYYIMYNLSIGLFEMSYNGIAYQYLWPNAPAWNEIASGVALYSASIFSLFFTREFLSLPTKAPLLNRIILGTIGLRTVFFLLCLLVERQWFIYKFLDAIPLLLAYFAGGYILRKKYHPARFFVAGYSFLLLGFVIRILKTLASQNFPFGPVNFYSLSFCFLAEMMFVSFAIGDKVRWLKKKKDLVQKRMIEEMRINQELKDNLNKELEHQVRERTKEVVEKSAVIEQQNEELLAVNDLLKQQAEEILRMNEALDRDNKVLQVDIKKVTQARVMSAEMEFEEFARIYPDDNAGLKFLADLKWEQGYSCRKCNNSSFFNGHLPYSRRCSKCSYEESATTNTIFQNAHIPLNKAFYMAYMVYSTKGKISSYKLSEILSIRQSTCWSYTGKVKKLMEERKKDLRDAGEKGWSKLVIK